MKTYGVLNILLRVKVGASALKRYLNELRIKEATKGKSVDGPNGKEEKEERKQTTRQR